jgi:hypothetical protein
VSLDKEAVMRDADQYRKLAREAMEDGSAAINENDRRALTDIACIWEKAAMASEKIFAALAKPQ